MPPRTRTATNKDNIIAQTCGILFFANQLHSGFNIMASIKEKAMGISISLRLNKAYTKSVRPNNITVLLI